MKKFLQLLTLSAMSLSASLSSAALEVGSEVANFAANDDTGEIWTVAEHLGKKNIVVYFYPAAMTGGCTAQACAYRDYSTNLDKADAIVVGVSGDSVKGLSLFKEAHNLNFPLLSDPNGSIAAIFGVPTRAGGSLEREVNGDMHTFFRNLTTSRWTFIIGKDGKIIYKNEEVNAREDTATVLAVLEKNK
ncbi:peroxiredoxin [Pelagicoccus sp. NFK12]|uniref:thioredoxin-dependent peroxiredoxin n=1 Tax=Pelagicoccus enzymogenes TaxID=2773457 RepID=A0A927FAK9_9BACT|nr:peroxiredoxin [Pelagicoccus enzymogenes]MBD5780261.1 peroxiredoxin [Pelagicoccus enzymogenes]